MFRTRARHVPARRLRHGRLRRTLDSQLRLDDERDAWPIIEPFSINGRTLLTPTTTGSPHTRLPVELGKDELRKR